MSKTSILERKHKPMLKINDLKASYGRVPVLHNIDMRIEQGEIVGLLGHNGMGKTTLLRTIMGYLQAKQGSIVLNGHEIQSMRSYQRARLGLTLVPQGREIFSNLSVHENLTIGILGNKGANSRIEEMLVLFPRLRDLMDRRGSSLSGGEQQVLALARCLCNRPSILLLDEPTEGVQPSIIQEMSNALKQLREKEGLTLLFAEQNLSFILGLATRVYTISNGIVDGEVSLDGEEPKARISEYLGFRS